MEVDDKNNSETSRKTDDFDNGSSPAAQCARDLGKTGDDKDVQDEFASLDVQNASSDKDKCDFDSSEKGDHKETNNQMSHRHRLSSSERSNTILEDQHVSPPKVNCPEKIIICVDASADMDKMSFRSRAGDKSSPKMLTKKGLSIFLQSKNTIDRKHEFALMLLGERAFWVRDFTNNSKDILGALDDSVETEAYEMCDIGSVFDKILEKIDLPKVQGDATTLPPPYTVRLLLIYGRSNCHLEFVKKESFNLLNSSPYFFFDALYIHDPPSEENCCQEVFDSICDLDQTGLSYIFSLNRNPTKLYSHMAQLLAHPLQRPFQGEASYRIGSSVPLTDNG